MNKICSLIIGIGVFINLNAVEINHVYKKDNNNVYHLEGYFTDKSYDVIKNFLEKNKNKEINIIPFSNGGSANDIFRIQKLIKNHGKVNIDTTLNGAYCYSACASTFFISNNIKGKMYFHKLSARSVHNTFNQSVYYDNLALKSILKNNGMSSELASRIINKENGFIALNINKNENKVFIKEL